MKRFFLYLVFFCGINSFLSAQNPEGFDKMVDGLYEYTIPFITAEKLEEKRQQDTDIVILDSRKKEEYNVSHIPGARFVDYKKFKLKSLKDIPKDTPIYVYCSVGYRSERTAEKLQEAGYTEVYNLYGGLFNWANHGFPMVNEDEESSIDVHGYNREWGQWLNPSRCTLQPSRLSEN